MLGLDIGSFYLEEVEVRELRPVEVAGQLIVQSGAVEKKSIVIG